MARELAEAEYDKYRSAHIAQADQVGSDFDRAIQQLPPPRPKSGGGRT
jgi:hypothetical protein